MPKFAANLSLLFTEHPLEERFKAAHRAGFQYVEIQFPYALTTEQMGEQLERCNQELILFNLPAGDWQAGDRGLAALPDRVDEFREGVELAIQYAKQLGVTKLNCLAGVPAPSFSAEQVESVLLENVKYAADHLADEGISLMIEGINSVDVKGFWLDRSEKVFKLIEQTGRNNIFMQYDLYHMQMMEGNLTNTLTGHLNKIGHIQIADLPGRHEPGTGEINFPFIFNTLDSIGYSGFVSLEYLPCKDTESGLSWLKEYVSNA